MTLASQRVRFRTGRSSSSSRFRRRKKQRNGRIIGGLLLLALLLGGGYWVITRIGGGPRPASAAEPDPEPALARAETNKPKPATREILMGQTPAPETASRSTPDRPTRTEMQTSAAEPLAPAQAAHAAESTPVRTEPPPPVSPTIEARQPTREPSGIVETFLQRGRQDQAAGKLVQARQVYNAALFHAQATESQKQVARALLSEVNQTLVFSPTVYEGDPLAEKYRVQKGDSLSEIVPDHGLAIHFHFLVRINRLRDANSLQLNQPLKLIRGPFHAVVDKSDYRIDLYAGDPPSPNSPSPGSAGDADGAEAGWLYIRSFNVGLGEGGGTPIGNFIVKSKDSNPAWRNPRTGETFGRDDPRNPIGEYWLGLQGVDEQSAQYTGYGIHGTIDPDSIGRSMSMGCVRMAADDIATVWEMLTENVSTVRIRP